MKYAKHVALHSGILRGAREGLELVFRLLPEFEPLDIRRVGVRKLLAARLDGEIFLGLRNGGLARISVLRDEVAREAGEVKIENFAFATRPEGDHFAGAGKMIGRFVTRLLARGYGALDRLLEAPPLAVAQKRLQVAGAPVLRAVLVDLSALLEGTAIRIGGDFVVHGVCSRSSLLPNALRKVGISAQVLQSD